MAAFLLCAKHQERWKNEACEFGRDSMMQFGTVACRCTRMNRIILGFVCLTISIPLACADQGGFLNSGGSLGGGTSVSSPQGTLTISGTTLTFFTSDGSTAINATFSANN